MNAQPASGLAGFQSGVPDGPATVADCRLVIDDLDGRILDLLRKRLAMSARVQTLRIAAGGTRIEHNRENAVLLRYADSLGPAGRDLALALLSLCRGPGPRPVLPPSRGAEGAPAC